MRLWHRVKGTKFSIGSMLLLVIMAFVVGTRFTLVGEWFFSPYSNSQNETLTKLDLGQVEEIYDILKKRYDGKLDIKELQEGLNKGLVSSTGDQHSVYLTPDEAAEFSADLNGSFSGIGAEIGRRNDRLTIIAPLAGSPAQKAGIRALDTIVEIDGKDATQLTVDEAVKKIRGEIGTKVTLTIQRGIKTEKITITRAEIDNPSVTSEILPDNIGLLTITRFDERTGDLARQAATEFANKKVKAVIVDLRDNPGGVIDAPVEVAGLWLENSLVAKQRTGGKVTSELRTKNNPLLEGVKTTILINGGSASASEILAGALHDHGVATLLGEKSYGKGSVQELINLKSGGQLKLTTAHWYTPKDKNIDKEGIKPDIEVKLTEEDINVNRDPQLQSAIDRF